jgi:hypothetical protein
MLDYRYIEERRQVSTWFLTVMKQLRIVLILELLMIPMGVVRLPGVEFIFWVKPTVGPLHSRPRFFISLTAVGTDGCLRLCCWEKRPEATGQRPEQRAMSKAGS